MCGIFGVILKPGATVAPAGVRAVMERLYLLSESRGKESAGLHAWLPQSSRAWTIKGAQAASEFVRTDDYLSALKDALARAWPTATQPACSESVVLLAHSRLVTNGTSALPQNNQPVRNGHVSLIHNGIIVNVDDLWQRHAELNRHAEVDTEVLAAILDSQLHEGLNAIDATRQAFGELRGAASVAWIHDGRAACVLATNTGDLFYSQSTDGRALLFASERYILQQIVRSSDAWMPMLDIVWLDAGKGLHVPLTDAQDACAHEFELAGFAPTGLHEVVATRPCTHIDRITGPLGAPTVLVRDADESLARYGEARIRALKRCSRCVLPETFPFIAFDDKGVCNYCRSYRPRYAALQPSASRQNFAAALERYRRAGKDPEVIVPFSGGRDSCYGLHLIKREFGLRPITFTYDWGMVTDLARRNIARFCGQLGVPNILVSANIRHKRDNIRRNVQAWLKRPDLGLIPLFMAGDKHFFKILNQLKQQTSLDLNIWSANPLENTDFKTGLCGVSPKFDKSRVDYLSLADKIRLLSYYGWAFAINPRFLNASLPDTASAFTSYYFEPRRDFFSLFHHVIWEEQAVNDLIINAYDFERAPDSPSTWRIGDGTAPFYNYIYVTARGFSEFDTFRSNQIREGQITREAALNAVVQENRPRLEGLRWYLSTIDLDFNAVVTRVNQLDRAGLHR